MGQTYRHAEQYINQLTPGCWVEIGTSRNGDDGSTKIIAEWASRQGKHLWTVDIDPNNCEFVHNLNIPNVEIINQSGEQFLKEFPPHIGYISFLYLDNFDWDWHPEKSEDFIVEQQKRYADLGMKMNNVNSQCAHLAQITQAIQALAPSSIVVCDDTWYNKWWGHYSGKGGAVVPFLLNNGYEVLYTCEDPEYGTILGRGIK
jgi:thiamine pyrophosphate-dependent acetolactate synthase large subunit-like protein